MNSRERVERTSGFQPKILLLPPAKAPRVEVMKEMVLSTKRRANSLKGVEHDLRKLEEKYSFSFQEGQTLTLVQWDSDNGSD